MNGRTVVASAQVIAGDAAHERYRIAVAPGNYRVVASNWPHIDHEVDVEMGAESTVDFLNGCD